MSKITIEAIDQVMERVPGATYAEVREALIKSDGDVIDAIILLQENSTEKENKNKNLCQKIRTKVFVAAELGFEPRMNESESLVLPLHHSAIESIPLCRPPLL